MAHSGVHAVLSNTSALQIMITCLMLFLQGPRIASKRLKLAVEAAVSILLVSVTLTTKA